MCIAFVIFKRIQSRISLVKEEYAERSFITDIWLCEKFTSCSEKKTMYVEVKKKTKRKNDRKEILNLLN